MTNLKGFLWSMGRCGTKALVETITDCTSADAPSWVDTPRLVDASGYFLKSYPNSFVVTLHFPQHYASYVSLLNQFRDRPVVLTVREPISNLKSYAKVFLNSYISRRVNDVIAHVARGGTVVGAIQPVVFDQWVVPIVDYWQHWSAICGSPNMVVDVTDLDESRFVDTMTDICDFLGLERTRPVAWQGVGNRECDNFFVGYAREFTILGRKMELRFSRWNNLWSEPGLVTLGALRAPELDGLLGEGVPLYVHAKADRLLTAGSIDRERDAFSALLGEPSLSGPLAVEIVRDHDLVRSLVQNELETLQRLLIAKYKAAYSQSVEKFVMEHPALRERWSDMSARAAA